MELPYPLGRLVGCALEREWLALIFLFSLCEVVTKCWGTQPPCTKDEFLPPRTEDKFGTLGGSRWLANHSAPPGGLQAINCRHLLTRHRISLAPVQLVHVLKNPHHALPSKRVVERRWRCLDKQEHLGTNTRLVI